MFRPMTVKHSFFSRCVYVIVSVYATIAEAAGRQKLYYIRRLDCEDFIKKAGIFYSLSDKIEVPTSKPIVTNQSHLYDLFSSDTEDKEFEGF